MWNPLRKQWIERPTPAQPCLTIAEDSELEMAIRIVKSVERRLKHMEKEMKLYIETIQHLDIADQNLTKNLTSCSLVHANDQFKKLVDNYHETTLQNGKTVQEAVEGYTKTFMEPVTALYDSFSRMRTGLNKREELVSAWKIAYANLKKYQDKEDKTSEQGAKLEKLQITEQAASTELKIFHANLLDEVLMFVKERLDYLEPCVNAFLTIQLIYNTQLTEGFVKLIPDDESPELPTSSMNSKKDYEQTINDQLDRIKSLAIIKK